MYTISFKAHKSLNFFLHKNRKNKTVTYDFQEKSTVKDIIESFNIPHPEVYAIFINGVGVGFDEHLKDQDIVDVYPLESKSSLKEVYQLRGEPNQTFILDAHLGTLAKYLRMLGFDTLYGNDYDDLEIVQWAEEHKRIALSRDIGLLKRGILTHGYFLRSQNTYEQLEEIINRYNLLPNIQSFSRCTACNGPIASVEKETITELLEEKTKKYFNEFYQCKSCDKVYWKGSHFDKMEAFIQKLKVQPNHLLFFR